MKIAFLDCDGVLFEHGTDDFRPGAQATLRRYHREGWHIVCFTARPMGPWFDKVSQAFGRQVNYMQKPLAEEYCWIDDLLNLKETGIDFPRQPAQS